MSADLDDRVRFQLAFSLGEAPVDRSASALTRLARDRRNGGEIRNALLSSVAGNADRIAAALLTDAATDRPGHAVAWLSELSLLAGADRESGAALRLLASATSAEQPAAVQRVTLAGIGEGLGRRGSSLSQLLAEKSTPSVTRDQVQTVFERAVQNAGDERQTPMHRAEAIGLLAFAEFRMVSAALTRLLSPRTPQALQRAAVAALSQQPTPAAGRALLARWRTFSPQLRRDAVDAILSSPARIALLLDAVEAESVRLGELPRDQKQRLLTHPTQSIRTRSQKLFGSEVNADRVQVVSQYRGVLELTGKRRPGAGCFQEKMCRLSSGG